MENIQKWKLTVGRLAKLLGIKNRTLHYYDEIGLFSPNIKGENGYRYYTPEQITDLELILAFRECGMPIPEIKTAIHSGADTVNALLSKEIADIDAKIQYLESMRRILKMKRELSAESQAVPFEEIERIVCEPETYVLSKKIVGTDDSAYYLAMQELMEQEGRFRLFNHDYGILMSSERILSGNFEEYDYFYIKSNSTQGKQTLLRPKGAYLRIVVKGPWDRLPAAYQKLLTYADRHGLTLTGFAYERGLNETLSTNMAEYVTEIRIQYR